MNVLRSTVMALCFLAVPTVVSAEVHKLTEAEYQKFIDDLIGAIEKGTVGVGGKGGGGGPAAGGGQPSNPAPAPGGNNDGDAGNDDQGDGIGESW